MTENQLVWFKKFYALYQRFIMVVYAFEQRAIEFLDGVNGFRARAAPNHKLGVAKVNLFLRFRLLLTSGKYI